MKKVLLTGASGNMGIKGLKELLKAGFFVRAFCLNKQSEIKKLKKFKAYKNFELFLGDLTNYEDVKTSVKNMDFCLHVGALVSPMADDHPALAMKVNYGSTKNLINAIKELKQNNKTKFVYIGTVAETGDRMPPIHWGRVGDPIKPSYFDYYAVSKIAAERLVIESELAHWVSLRQTGIVSVNMFKTRDNIIFHQPLDNVLEYVSDRDSGRLLKNVCRDLPSEFWNNIYNIGGGKHMRLSGRELLEFMFAPLGVNDIGEVFESNTFATHNFHGQYYLDSDKLNSYLNFRQDGKEYINYCLKKSLGLSYYAVKYLKFIPPVKNVILKQIKNSLTKLKYGKRGTMSFIEENNADAIKAFFISKKAWEAIPKFKEFTKYKDYNTVIKLDHGYDESKPKEKLNFEDLKNAIKFRGGKLLSKKMQTGDLKTKLDVECSFNHKFKASPKLILESGHWCDTCERESWNYHKVAKHSKFFNQVWKPLHKKDEEQFELTKEVSELDV